MVFSNKQLQETPETPIFVHYSIILLSPLSCDIINVHFGLQIATVGRRGSIWRTRDCSDSVLCSGVDGVR